MLYEPAPRFTYVTITPIVDSTMLDVEYTIGASGEHNSVSEVTASKLLRDLAKDIDPNADGLLIAQETWRSSGWWAAYCGPDKERIMDDSPKRLIIFQAEGSETSRSQYVPVWG